MRRLEGLDGRVGKVEEQSRLQEDRINDILERLNNQEGNLADLMGKIEEVLSKYETFEDKIRLMQSLSSNESGSGDLSGKYLDYNQIYIYIYVFNRKSQ